MKRVFVVYSGIHVAIEVREYPKTVAILFASLSSNCIPLIHS